MKLGVVILGALLTGGCLMPQEDDPLEDLPPLKNRPPRLLRETMNFNGDYNIEVTAQMGADCPTSTFEARVEDPDLTDTIRYSWFVDYDKDELPVRTGKVTANGQPVRESIRLPITPGSVDNPLQQEGLHVVQLIVSDGILEVSDPPGTVPPPDPVPGVDAGNPRYIDEFTWLVNVTTAACPVAP